MSGELLFDVLNCDGFGKPAFKLLLIALADRADESGVCWPSRSDLVLRTGLSVSSITRTARALESAGWIQRKQRRDASTVYRLNVLKVSRCAAQCKADRRLRRAGSEWELFPEEKAQAIDNNGEGQPDPGSGQHERTTGQPEHLTSQEPPKNLKAPAAANCGLEKGAKPSGRSVAPVDPSALSPFQRSRVLAGQSVAIAGAVLLPDAPEADALRKLLRSQGAEKGRGHV